MAELSIRRHARVGVLGLVGLVASLVVGALVLWLSSGPAGHADVEDQVQGTTVSVQGKAISWEDNARCGALRESFGYPSPAVAADFGSSPPGGGQLGSAAFLGCVLSNATWNVEALASPLTSGAESIPAANLTLQALSLNEATFPGFGDTSPAPIDPACDGFVSVGCGLGTTQTVVTGAQPSPESSGFYYTYRLDVPGSAPSGVYTGSVTFTASN
jgi:hypothetical protein